LSDVAGGDGGDGRVALFAQSARSKDGYMGLVQRFLDLTHIRQPF